MTTARFYEAAHRLRVHRFGEDRRNAVVWLATTVIRTPGIFPRLAGPRGPESALIARNKDQVVPHAGVELLICRVGRSARGSAAPGVEADFSYARRRGGLAGILPSSQTRRARYSQWASSTGPLALHLGSFVAGAMSSAGCLERTLGSRSDRNNTGAANARTGGASVPKSEALVALTKRKDLDRFGVNALGVFALQLRFGGDDVDVFADSVTDREGDRKCDIVHIDEEFRVVVIAQVYSATDLTKSTPPLNKASDLHVAASWILDPDHADVMPLELRSAAGLLRAAIEEADVDAIEFWYVHNLPESQDVNTELEKVAITAAALLKSTYGDVAIGINCRGMQIGRAALDGLYARRTQRVLIEDEISVPAQGWISETGDSWKAVCTSVPGSWLRELHERYGADQLFSGNVRDYLGGRRSTQNINYTIEQTALDRPRDFWAFNNGVTAVVREVTEGDNKLSVRGITIVNGAQTTGALSNAHDVKDVMVLTRFVQCSDPEVVESIIRANNTQNEIRASDFEAWTCNSVDFARSSRISRERITPARVAACSPAPLLTRTLFTSRRIKQPSLSPPSTTSHSGPIMARARYGRTTRFTRGFSPIEQPQLILCT
jgi:hypothetical protein